MTKSQFSTLNIREIDIKKVKNEINNIYNNGVTKSYVELNLNESGPFFFYEQLNNEYKHMFFIYDISKNKILKVTRLYTIQYRLNEYRYTIHTFINTYYPSGYCIEFKFYIPTNNILKL